jgi:hypothetical protein
VSSAPLPSQAPQNAQVLAYGAVLYALPEGSTATLRLKIAGSATGTPQVAACPTIGTAWSAGDDQPSSSEPAYDCTTQHYAGTISADGATMTFQLKAQFEATPGLVSMAIVPDVSSTALPTGSSPFSVDFAPPDASSLTPAPTGMQPSSSEPLPPPSSLFTPPSPIGAVAGSAGQYPRHPRPRRRRRGRRLLLLRPHRGPPLRRR